MKRTLTILFLVLPGLLLAQLNAFNQYNAALGAINPAYIAHIDRDQAALSGRSQWPDHRLGSLSAAFNINRHFPKLNSGFGLSSYHSKNNSGLGRTSSVGLQYGYRLMFLDDHYICFGGGLGLGSTQTDINNYDLRYSAKANTIQQPSLVLKTNSINGSFGIIFTEMFSRYYGGFSFRNVQLYSFGNDLNGILKQGRTFSMHGMYRMPIDRRSFLLFFLSYERTGSTQCITEQGTQVLQAKHSLIFSQANVYVHKVGVFGIGYKYYAGNYGSLNCRLGISPFKEKKVHIGYSFDVKPYISGDRIQANCSHELYIKTNIEHKY